MTRQIFIGGTGRSGTSIIKRVIASHDAVASFPIELRAIVDPGGALDLAQALTARWSPYAGDMAIRRFEALLGAIASTNIAKKAFVRLAQRFGFSPPSYLDFGIGDHVGLQFYRSRCMQLLNSLSPSRTRGIWAGMPGGAFPGRFYETPYPGGVDVHRELERFFDDLFERSANDRPVTHWVEDTPYNLLHVNELRVMFPRMRFIHVYRDFRDVAASYRVQPWGSADVRIAAKRVAGIVARWLELRSLLDEQELMEVGLESVVQDRQAFYDRFLAFVGLSRSDAMEQKLEQLDPRLMHGGRWKRELGEEDQVLVQKILGPAIRAYGYD